jgi:hypothetical protein
MRNHRINNSPSQSNSSVHRRVNVKRLAHELGVHPKTFRWWLRRQYKHKFNTQWTWSKREAVRIAAQYDRWRP